jgi:hypothetical protein
MEWEEQPTKGRTNLSAYRNTVPAGSFRRTHHVSEAPFCLPETQPPVAQGLLNRLAIGVLVFFLSDVIDKVSELILSNEVKIFRTSQRNSMLLLHVIQRKDSKCLKKQYFTPESSGK